MSPIDKETVMLMFPAPPPAPFAVSTTTFSGPVAGEHEPLLGGPRRCIAGVLPVWRRTLFRRKYLFSRQRRPA